MVTTHPVWNVAEVRVDYLTLTGKTPEEREHLRTCGIHLTRLGEQSGEAVVPFVWNGYRGLSTRHCSWGERDDTVLLRVSGDRAAEVWRRCAEHHSNCTRLDLAVTARATPPAANLTQLAYQQAKLHAEAHTVNGLVSIIVDNRGGSTCYIGSRTSERFARLYNKEAESGDAEYKGCWRWEVEYKAEAAAAILRELHSARVSETFIRGTVHRHFRNRGTEPPWDAGGSGAAIILKRDPPDSARRLEWLRVQVAPSVARAVYDSGLVKVLHVLGLQRYISTAELQRASKAPSATLCVDSSPLVDSGDSAENGTEVQGNVDR